MKILFDSNHNPIAVNTIKQEIANFKKGYREATHYIIANSINELDKNIFFNNIAYLMPKFGMTRRGGPFYGVKLSKNNIILDPNCTIDSCWTAVGNDLLKLKAFILDHKLVYRSRTLVELSPISRTKVIIDLMDAFKKLLYTCMGKSVRGTVGASKVLFAVFPEVALPVDNTQWHGLFDTHKDYSQIIRLMAQEIVEWERITGQKLEQCDSSKHTTLPAIYNVMAMAARP